MKYFKFYLLALSLVYLAFFLIDIDSFPLYFFCDEAVHGVDAFSLIRSGTDMHGTAWPMFFRGLGDYPLALTVYLQIPSVLLFGLSEFSVRLTTVVLSLIGVMASYGLLRYVYSIPHAYLVVPLFMVSPFWFIHARTGFEYVPATAFFIVFLLFYCLAYSRDSRFSWLFPVFAAASFYSYTPARGWIAGTLVLLLLFNFLTHLRLWRRTLFGFFLLGCLLLPYIVFHISQPDAAMQRLVSLNFAGFKEKSVADQFLHMGAVYLETFKPANWFIEDAARRISGERHYIPDLSPIPWWISPFVLLGLLLVAFNVTEFHNRAVLAALLAVPLSASLVEFNHQRTMPVAALALIFSTIGLSAVTGFLARSHRLFSVLPPAVFLAVAFYALWFRSYVEIRAPVLYRNYGFYGLQIGAPEVFRWIKENHRAYSEINLIQGSFNAAYVFPLFYLDEEAGGKVKMPFVESICAEHEEFSNSVWILRYEQLEWLKLSNCPLTINILHTIYDPRGAPLFRMLELELISRESLLEWRAEKAAAREEARATRYSKTLHIESGSIIIEYPKIGAGEIGNLFDGNPDTIIRVDQINPANFSISFELTELRAVEVLLAPHTTKALVTVTSYYGDEATALGTLEYDNKKTGGRRLMFQTTTGTIPADRIEIEVLLTDWASHGSPHISLIEWR